MTATPANSAKPQPPALHPTQSSRRSFLTLTALTALGAGGVPVMAGCRLSKVGADGGASSGSGGSTSSVSASPAPTDFQTLDARIVGHRLSVRVSPLVRTSEEATALVLEFTRAADDAAMVDVQQHWNSDSRMPVNPYMTDSVNSSVRLLDPDQGRVWITTLDSLQYLILAPGESDTVYIPFGPVDIDQVTAFIPQTGFVPLGVIDRDTATTIGIDLAAMDKTLGKLSTDSGRSAPVRIESFTEALDDSTNTRTTDQNVTVTLSSDVTFDSDSAADCRDLFINQVESKQVAITMLDMVSDQIGGSGKVAILSATANAANQNAWIKFMEDEIASNDKYKGIEIVAKVYGDDDDTKSFQEAQGLLQAHPDLNAIVSPTTVGIAATARYLSTSDYKGKVFLTGLGLPNEMRSFVKDGTVKEFALWDPAQLGYVAAYAGAALDSGAIKSEVGEKFTAGNLGERTIGENKTVVVGDPVRFNADNIDKYDF